MSSLDGSRSPIIIEPPTLLPVKIPSSEKRPEVTSSVSEPVYKSPLRQHRRLSSRSREVKETINAKSQYGDGPDEVGAVHSINQYQIKQEIGRGSFGSVHLAVDQHGTEFAVKEFSKSRLRKRAQSHLLRRPSKRRRPGFLSANTNNVALSPKVHGIGGHEESTENHAFDLIREEIAIMKKINHPNVVSLLEVLDDPEEDSLYMVLEMCKKGVVMKVGLDERAEPYDEEKCRCLFRDMILGLEYLHAQGILHRDLKPDNCLITEDDVLKIVDFGVSEIFDKQSDMSTSKSVGSPAFMPPELCIPQHGPVSGRAVDIWSLGVTLYCLRYGSIPFDAHGLLQLYQAIRMDRHPLPPLNPESDVAFHDLMDRLLAKDPKDRIQMQQLRVHPWVTRNGEDPLLSEQENCQDMIEEPTKEEVDAAITGKWGHLFAVAKVVKAFLPFWPGTLSHVGPRRSSSAEARGPTTGEGSLTNE